LYCFHAIWLVAVGLALLRRVLYLWIVAMWIFFGVFLSRVVSSTGICMLCTLNFL
jgi:hypothetical protein